jgi:phosphonate transport system ATP-binding protein
MTPRQLRQARAAIGFVHQDLRLVPNLRVVQNVLAGRLGSQSLLQSLRSVFFTPRALALEAHEVLERVGIPEKLYERTDRLSGGQRQRVAIARALFQQPVALLADEPVSSVDPARARDAVQLLASISREYGLTLGVSLHTLHLAQEFFPRLIGLRGGRVLFDEPTTAIDAGQFEALYRLAAPETIDDAS